MKSYKNLAEELFFTNGTFDSRKARWNANKAPWLSELSGSSVSEKIWNLFHTRPLCACGNLTKYWDFTHGYRSNCSKSCGQSSSVTISKRKETLERKYGTDNLWSNEDFKRAVSEKMAKSKTAKALSRKIEEAKSRGFILITEAPTKASDIVKWKHICGVEFERPFQKTKYIACPKCSVSNIQGLVFKAAQEVDDTVISNYRQGLNDRREIDIFSPKANIGFEVNGSHWHQDQTRDLDKIQDAKVNGIKVVTIQDVELITNEQAVLSRVQSLLMKKERIYARKCSVLLGTTASLVAHEFLTKYHTQGYVRGTSICLTLNGQVLAVMTVGKSRFGKDKVLEIYRWCVKPGITIIGGFQKCFSHFNVQECITYCDARWSPDPTDTIYHRAGFTLVGKTKPGYVWKRGNIVLSRGETQKQKLLQQYPEFDMDMTEDQIMTSLGFEKVLNYGNWIFKK